MVPLCAKIAVQCNPAWRVVARAVQGGLERVMMTDRPDWMAKAARVAAALQAQTAGARGASHSVYVVLLRNPARPDPWGLYVGQTSRDPDLRFDQHKAGYKASGAVKRFGVRLMPELFAHLNPMRRWEALELEAGLALDFTVAGIPWVAGGH